MVEIPSFSVICELLEGKQGIWKQVKPMVKLALLVSPGLAMESFALMEILEKGLTWTDSADLAENGLRAIREVFGKKENSMDELRKLQLANTLLIYSAYFRTLQENNPTLWDAVKLTGQESHNLAQAALTVFGQPLVNDDCPAILPSTGMEKLARFYTLLNDQVQKFASGLDGVKVNERGWNDYPAEAVKVYRDQYRLLRQRSESFRVWSDGLADEQLLRQRDDQPSPPAKTPTTKKLDLPLGEVMKEHRFLGREDLLETLWERVKKEKSIVLSGLGGIGKTELAKYFGYRYHLETRCKVYYVTFAESFENTVIRSISTGIPDLPEGLPEKEIYSFVMDQLRQCGEGDLLIIDNADREEGCFDDLKDRAYADLNNLSMHLMITTRFQDPDFLEVPRICNEALYEIFKVHKAYLNREQMNALIEAVDGHTMTIDLIARTYRRSGETVTPEKLLDAIKDSTLDEVTWRVKTEHDKKHQRIYAHLRALFNLSGLSDDRKMLLRYATLFPQDGLAPTLFLTAVGWELGEETADLVDRGWIRLENDVYTIHPVIRLVCREELKPTDENCGAFLKELRGQYDPNQYAATRFRQLAQLFAIASENLEDRAGEWAGYAGFFWDILGESENALKFLLQTVKTQEINMQDDVELAIAYSNLGVAYGKRGEFEIAIEYGEKAIKIIEEVFSPDDPIVVSGYRNVGLWYSALGNHLFALVYQLKAMAIVENENPLDPYELGVCSSNLGEAYRRLGDYDESLRHQLRALELFESVLQKNHPILAGVYNNVGVAYGDLGNNAKALEYQLKALAIRKEILPLNHPEIANSYINVGGTYKELGDNRKALEYELNALRINEAVLPETHPALLANYNNMSTSYFNLGEYAKALEYQMKVSSCYENNFPQTCSELAVTYSNIGTMYNQLGDKEKGLDYYLKALGIRESMLPQNHPSLAVSYANLGVFYKELGDYGTALEYLQKSIAIREEVLPSSHPDLASSYSNAGTIYTAMGDYVKAMECWEKALTILEGIQPTMYRELAISYDQVADIYSKLGDPPKVLEYRMAALDNWRVVLPEDSWGLAECYNKVSDAYGDVGRYRESLECEMTVLRILEKVLPPDQLNKAICYENIAVTYARMDDFENALSYRKRAIEIEEQLHSENLEEHRAWVGIIENLKNQKKNDIPFENPFK